jgi:hypothetical protein
MTFSAHCRIAGGARCLRCTTRPVGQRAAARPPTRSLRRTRPVSPLRNAARRRPCASSLYRLLCGTGRVTCHGPVGPLVSGRVRHHRLAGQCGTVRVTCRITASPADAEPSGLRAASAPRQATRNRPGCVRHHRLAGQCGTVRVTCLITASPANAEPSGLRAASPPANAEPSGLRAASPPRRPMRNRPGCVRHHRLARQCGTVRVTCR